MAGADLQPSEVLLLYNSQVPESAEIALAYLTAHPGVQTFDINVVQPILSPGDPQGDPQHFGINNQFITRTKFNELFGPGSAFRTYQVAHPEILAIATTRGLPAAVVPDDSDFDMTPGEAFPPTFAIVASFEAKLSHPGIIDTDPGGEDVHNSYYYKNLAFRAFVAGCSDDGVYGVAPGDMYLVSRLDSNPPIPPVDVNNDGLVNHLDGVLALIQRSLNLTVTKHAVNIVFDDPAVSPSTPNYHWVFIQEAARMYDGGFCVLFDETTQFIHGPTDPDFEPAVDGLYNQYPLLVLGTWGRNHDLFCACGAEVPIPNYIQHYNPHPAGFFHSIESGNGWYLHSPGDPLPFNQQGQVLDWIAKGGSFTVGNVAEPSLCPITDLMESTAPNLYLNGLTWGEAIYSGLRELGQFQTPIGDPMATVEIHDFDLGGDHCVLFSDITLAANGLVDVNHDGSNDAIDLLLVAALMPNFLERCCTVDPVASPTPMWPMGGFVRCGDFNCDGRVDGIDLAMAPPVPSFCPTRDMTGDGWFTIADLHKLEMNQGLLIGDCNNDGVIDELDVACVQAAASVCFGDPAFNPLADVDCDLCVIRMDTSTIKAIVVGHPTIECPSIVAGSPSSDQTPNCPLTP